MKILEPYHSKELNLKNRVAMAPMTRTRVNNPELAADQLLATHYRQRASAGLIISEGTSINEDAFGYTNVPGIFTREQIDGWRLVTDTVHAADGKIFAQLWHVGRISHPSLLQGRQPIAPSAINANFRAFTNMGFADTADPREMTTVDIFKTVQDFVKAAKNAIDAGFDGAELHAAHGYLFQQFFSKCSNIRTDAYGGSIENRARFLFDVLDAIAEALPLSKIGVRISPDLTGLFGIVPDDETEAIYQYIASRLNDYGIAYLHVSGFSLRSEDKLPNALKAASQFRGIYKGTLMINGGFDGLSAEQVINEGLADLVSFGELYIANPDLPERFLAGGPFNNPRKDLYYGQSEEGYIDYPALNQL